ncbi:MAG: electron transport complex subunit RsxC [Huintestinicola sp.]
MKKLNGIHLNHRKNTVDCETMQFPMPKKLYVLMSQSMGAPCDCLVKAGDEVTAGMKIGDSQAFMSAPIHSPASGKVTAISDARLPSGGTCKCVEIETDDEQKVSPDISAPVITDRDSFIKAVRESGCCGLGGAGFPTHIKLAFDPKKTPIDTLVVNGAECEPYITADYREFMENGKNVADGIRFIMKMLSIPLCKIGIESNKPDAIACIKKETAEDSGIEVVTLPQSYPQGAEKVLIYSCTGRIVGEGELPSNQGVVVMNVSTIGFLMDYIRTGMPLIRKRLTLDGSAMTKNQGNYFVPVGTPVSDLLEYCGADEPSEVLYGGPMMGVSLSDTSQPVTKVNNAVLAFKEYKKAETTSCIRCGRCIRACPLDLMPTELESAYDRKDVPALQRLKVMLCMNCGCCTYVCPAHRHLAEKNQLAKGLIPRPAKK